LKNIELQYKDDNVKVNIRGNHFSAPHYLIIKIKKLINNLVYQAFSPTFQCIENNYSLTTDENSQLEQIARQFKCHYRKHRSHPR
jgi:hypothetical protein